MVALEDGVEIHRTKYVEEDNFGRQGWLSFPDKARLTATHQRHQSTRLVRRDTNESGLLESPIT